MRSPAAFEQPADGDRRVEGGGPGFQVRALLLARDELRLAGIVTALREHGIQPTVVDPNENDAFALLERDPRVSVLGVWPADLRGGTRDTLLRVLFDQPRLKTFVVGATGALASRLRKLGVDQLHPTSADPGDIARDTAASLATHCYDADVAAAIADSLGVALEGARLSARPLPPLLRVGAKVLGQVSAVIVLGGDNIHGRVILSGPSVFFDRLTREWLQRKPRTKAEIWDAAGELCNRATGFIRQHYLGRGLESRQSTPTVIDGTSAEIRGVTSHPSLVVPFECDRIADPLFVELVLAWKGEDEATDESMLMSSDELTFF